MASLRTIFICTALALAFAGCTGEPSPGPGKGPGDNGTPGGPKPAPEGMVTEVFDRLDLTASGLEKVKAAVQDEDYGKAGDELLKYYRSRAGVSLPDVSLLGVTATETERKYADESLQYKFFAHSGYQPSYCYLISGRIDWNYWPVRDNELRWQLHRHKWFVPLGKAYMETHDEKYAKAWVEHYSDWMTQNPIPPDGANVGGDPAYEYARYAWRSLEIAIRAKDQCEQWLYLRSSPAITAVYLTRFLDTYARGVEYMLDRLSAQGNHLLFEAEGLVYAGTFWREFKNAAEWRERGASILAEELDRQVMADGMQYELDFGYHMGAINSFLKSYDMSKLNGHQDAFDPSYGPKVNAMVDAFCNVLYPDYSQPLFSDNHENSRRVIVRNLASWRSAFPNDNMLKYLATERAQGTTAPTHLPKQFTASGFYVLRSGWDDNSTMMVHKNGWQAFFHNQPDNGTFEMWRKGRNFFPDSGSYLYSGDANTADRDLFRKTSMHNTLTLAGANITTQDGQPVLFTTTGTTDICVTKNAAYAGLTHRRSIFFVERSFFVIVDEATGAASGSVELNWHLKEPLANGVIESPTGAHTTFSDNNNIIVKTATPAVTLTEMTGWVSYAYRVRTQRRSYKVAATKTANQPLRFITVIYPIGSWTQAQSNAITGAFTDSGYSENGMSLRVTAGGNQYDLTYTLNQ